MLQTLSTTGGACHKAWKLYDEYSHSADFRLFIKSSLHFNTHVSSEISHRYLSEKCSQLIDAHDQYTQTMDLSVEHKKSILAINTGGYAGIKRFRDSSSDGSKTTSRKPGGEIKKSKPISQGGGTKEGPSVPTSAFLVTLKKACATTRPELYPPAIRNKITSLPKMDKEQCEAAILAGNCIICHEKHRYRQCPVLKGNGPTAVLAKQLLKEYHLIRKVENSPK